MKADELNEKLVVAEDALAALSTDELVSLLQEIGYSEEAINLLKQYQEFVIAFRKKIG